MIHDHFLFSQNFGIIKVFVDNYGKTQRRKNRRNGFWDFIILQGNKRGGKVTEGFYNEILLYETWHTAHFLKVPYHVIMLNILPLSNKPT